MKSLKRFVLAAVAVAFICFGVPAYAKTLTMEEALEAAKTTLNGTTWSIELVHIKANNKKETINDTLSFNDGKVSSAELVKAGYQPSSFSVRLKEDDTIIWETMQKNEDGGEAYWSGRLKDAKMRGMLSWHVSKRSKKDYSFVSTASQAATVSTVTAVSSVK